MAKLVKFTEDIVKQIDKKRLTDKTLVTPEEFEALKSLSGEGYYGVQRTGKLPDRFKKEKYSKFMDPTTMSSQEMEKIAKEKQGGWEVAGNTLASFATNALSSFFDSWGTVDIGSAKETLSSKNSTTFGNPLNMAANQIREWGNNQFPIYNDDDGIFSWEYLATQLSSMGTTAGFVGGTMSQIGVGNKVAGVLGVAKILPYLRNASKVGSMAEKAIGGLSWAANNKMVREAASGALMGAQETYINSLETANSVFQDNREKFGDEKAAEMAHDAMRKHFAIELMPSMLLNALSWGATLKFKPFSKSQLASGYSDVLGTVLEKGFAKIGIKSKGVNKVLDYGTQMVAESFEEGVQTGAGSVATYLTDKKYSKELGQDLTEGKNWTKYVFNNGWRDSVIGGTFGGFAFRGIRGIANRRNDKAQEARSVEVLGATYEVQKEMTAELNKALQERIAIKSKLKESTTKEEKEVFSEMLKKNTAYIANIRNAAQLNISQSALLMDYEKGDDNLTTFNMTIANLEKARDAAKNGDVKVLEEMGLNDKDDLNSIADNMDDIIKDANRYKDNMLNNLKMQYKVNGRDDFWAAEKMAEKQMEIQKNEDVISETEKGFDEIVDGMFNSVQSVDNTWQKQFFKDATLLQAIKQSPEIREQYTEEEITQLEDNVKQKLEGKGFKQQAKRIYNTISQGAIANVEKIHAFQSKNIKLQEEADKYLNEKEVKQRKKDEIKNRINEYKKETDIDKLKKYKERLEEKYVQDAYESTEELEKIGQEIDKRISLQTERNEKFAREQAAAANAKREAAEKAARDKANGIETPDEKSPEELAKEAATKEVARKAAEEINSLKAKEAEQAEQVTTGRKKKVPETPTHHTIEEDNPFMGKPKATDYYNDSFSKVIDRNVAAQIEKMPNATFEEIVNAFLEGGLDKAKAEELWEYLYKSYYTLKFEDFNAHKAEVDALYNKIFSDSQREIDEIDEISYTAEEPKNADENVVFTGRKLAKGVNKIPFSIGYVYEKVKNFVIRKADRSPENVQKIANNPRMGFLLNPKLTVPGTIIRAYLPTNEEIAEMSITTWEDNEGHLERKYDTSFEEWQNTPEIRVAVGKDGLPLYAETDDFVRDINKEIVKDEKGNPIPIKKGEEVRVLIDKSVGSKEWLRRMPILGEVQIPGTDTVIDLQNIIHQYDWWNESNVTDTEVREQGKAIVDGFRKAFWEMAKENRNKRIDLEITANEGFKYNQIDDSEPMNPISKANKDALLSVYVSLSNGTFGIVDVTDTSEKGTVKILPKDRIELNNASIANGSTVLLTPISYNSKGEPIYTVIQVNNFYGNPDSKASERISAAKQEALNKLKQIRKAAFEIKELFRGQVKNGVLVGKPGYFDMLDNKSAYSAEEIEAKKKQVTEVLELAGFGNRITGLLETKSIKVLNEEFLNMYPSEPKDGVRGILRANVDRNFLTNNINLLVLTGYTDGQPNFKVYQSENAKEGDSSYVQYLKDNVYTNVDFQEIMNLEKPGETMKILNVQPAISLDIKGKHTPSINVQEVIEAEKKSQETPVVPKETTVSSTPAEEVKAPEEKKEDGIRRNTNGDIISITSAHKELVIRNLFGNIVSDFKDFSEITEKDIAEALLGCIDKYLSGMKDTHPKEFDFISKYRDAFLGIGTHREDAGTLREILLERFRLSEEDFDSVDLDDNSVDKNYSQSSFEVDSKMSLSERAKMHFSKIEVSRRSLPEFGGLVEYMDIDDVFTALQEVLSDRENTSEAIEKYIAEKMELNPVEFGFLNHILNKFKELANSEDGNYLSRELLFNLNLTKINMDFVYAYTDYENVNVMKVMDANSKSPIVGTKISYTEALKTSPLVRLIDKDRYRLNKEIAADLQQELKNLRLEFLKETPEIDFNALSTTLSYFGIDVYSDILESMFKKKASFQSVINLSKILESNLKKFTEAQDKVDKDGNVKPLRISRISDNVLLYNNNTFIREFIESVIEHTYYVNQSMYIAGKSINSFAQPNYASEQLRKLKSFTTEDLNNNPEHLVNQLKNSPYSKHSLLLKLITETNEKGELSEEAVKNLRKLDISIVSLEAFKRKEDKRDRDRGLPDLPNMDYDNAQLGFFNHRGQEVKIGIEKYSLLKYRKARVFFPTMSDTGSMFLFDTVVLDLKDNNLDFDNGIVTGYSSTIAEMLYENLVLPELERIVMLTGQNSIYGKGGEIFSAIPSLNMVEYNDGNTSQTILEYLKNTPYRGKELLTKVQEKFKEGFQSQIEAVIKGEVNRRFSIDKQEDGKQTLHGEWVDNGYINQEGVTSILDDSYLDSKIDSGSSTGIKEMQVASYDFVINDFLAKAQIQMLFGGDIANYAKVDESLFEDGDVSKPKYKEGTSKQEQRLEKLRVYTEISEKAGDVLSKRLKSVISPGNRQPYSKNQKYLQVMVEDIKDMSSVFEQYAKLWYGKLSEEDMQLIDEMKDLTQQLRDAEMKSANNSQTDKIDNNIQGLEKSLKIVKDKIAEKFPQAASYLENAGTDAQEYTTWGEHLYNMYSTGEITEKEYNNLKTKLRDQTLHGINENNKLTNEEKGRFQPMKPLHSGMYFDKSSGVSLQRMVYIKSSSFPLLPELTLGTDLDNMRKAMENLENTSGKFVRASFQSANKVGAVKTPIKINRLYSGEVTPQELEIASLELDRENFSIQQKKPDKTIDHLLKQLRDENNIGTQLEKSVLSSGVSEILSKDFNNLFDDSVLEKAGVKKGDNLSGQDLYKIYTYLYTELQNQKREALLEELEIDKDNFEIGSIKSMEKLQKALSQRLSNRQDKEILELEYIVENEDGTTSTYTRAEIEASELTPVRAEFTFPLWLSPNSNKFESVLNAIVANDLIKLKLPGNSFIVGSSEGIRTKSVALSSIGTEIKSGIIYSPRFDKNQRELLPEREDPATGEILPAQVMISSKFRKTIIDENGKTKEVLIDLVKDGYVDENGLLDLEKIPLEVLQLMTFRIPTSAHQSGSLVEVVGFLPQSSADLMVVPKEHTTKIGEDYDIDARYTYSGNYTIDKTTGKISWLKADDQRFTNISSKEKLDELYKEYKDKSRELEAKINKLNYSNKQKKVAAELSANRLIIDTIEAGRKNNLPIDESFLEHLKDKNKEYEAQLESMPNRDKLFKELNAIQEEFLKNKNNIRIFQEYITENQRRKLNINLLENNIINIYKSVYSSNNEDVRKLINATINTDLSDKTVKSMDKVTNTSNPETFSLLSSTYHKEVMRKGASGKLGISVHSVWVVSNALYQQMDKKLVLQRATKLQDSDEKIYVPYNLRMGNFQSNGKLGLKSALNPVNNLKIYENMSFRTLADINMENQNSSTDNQNKGIMGRRNENKYTINIFALMCNLGFDKDIVNGQEMHLPSLFLNQPILRRYVELMEKYQSSYAGYTKDLDDKIAQILKEEFAPTLELSNGGFLVSEDKEKASNLMSGQNLFNSLSKDTRINYDDFMVQQLGVFETFIELKGFLEDLSKIQKVTNVRPYGKSFFDVISAKEIAINEIFYNDDPEEGGMAIKGVEALIGDYPTEPVKNTEEGRALAKELKNQGFIEIGVDKNNYIILRKPNNFNTAKLLSALSTTYRLWSNIFPYENYAVKNQIDTVMRAVGQLDKNTQYANDLRYKVKNAMQEFIYSNYNFDIFEKSIEEERYDLFMDERDEKGDITKESLATYLNKLKMSFDKAAIGDNRDKNSKKARELFSKNFFRNLQFEISFGEPSIIKYNVNNNNSFNKNRPHGDLSMMMNSKIKLPAFNGDTDYTYEKLVRDLTKYALLASSEGGAISFRNHIPMAVFKKYGIDKELKRIADLHNNSNLNFNLLFNGTTRAIAQITGDDMIYTEGDKTYLKNKLKGSTNNEEQLSKAVERLNKELGNQVFEISPDKRRVYIKDANYENSLNIFLRQYFQHNPTDSYRLSIEKIGKVKFETLKSVDKFKVNFANDKFVEPGFLIPEFLHVRNSKGEVLLYQVDKFMTSNITQYRRINTLGGKGYNEYDTSRDIDKSLNSENNFKETGLHLDSVTANANPITSEANKSLKEATTVREAIGILTGLNSSNLDVLKAIETLNFLSNFIDGDIQIRHQNLGKDFYGAFIKRDTKINGIEVKEGNIYMNTQNMDSTYPITLLEEVLHSMLSKEISQYIEGAVRIENTNAISVIIGSKYKNFTGTPQYVKDIIKLYGDAATKYYTEILNQVKGFGFMNANGSSLTLNDVKEFMEETNANRFSDKKTYNARISKVLTEKIIKERQTNAEDKVFENFAKEIVDMSYRFSNLDEFMAGFFSDSRFKEKMASYQYQGSTKNLLERFKEFLENLLNTITNNTIEQQGIETIFGIITENKKEALEKLKTVRNTPSVNDLSNSIRFANGVLKGASSSNSTTELREYTPENITSLNPNEVFVFGSNAEGVHGKGAALLAKQKFGAKQGQATGLQGQSYAIITKKNWRVEKSSTLEEIGEGLADFFEFANNHPEKKFYMTKLGSSLAGYTVEEIKQQIKEVNDINGGNFIGDNVILPKEYEVREKVIIPQETEDGGVSYRPVIQPFYNSNSMSKAAIEAREERFNQEYGAIRDSILALTKGKVKINNKNVEAFLEGLRKINDKVREDYGYSRVVIASVDALGNSGYSRIVFNKAFEDGLYQGIVGMTEREAFDRKELYDDAEQLQLKNQKEGNYREVDGEILPGFLGRPVEAVKPGVAEVFESNPELANSVYEALGFNNDNIELKPYATDVWGKVPQQRGDNSFVSKEQYSIKLGEDKGIDIRLTIYFDDINKTAFVSNIENFENDRIHPLKKGLGLKGFLKANQLIISRGYTPVVDNLVSGYGYDMLLKLEKNGYLTKVLDKKVVDSQYDNIKYEKSPFIFTNKIYEHGLTIEQKQQAQQLYSQFLDKFIKRNFDKLVLEMENKNLIEKKCN